MNEIINLLNKKKEQYETTLQLAILGWYDNALYEYCGLDDPEFANKVCEQLGIEYDEYARIMYLEPEEKDGFDVYTPVLNIRDSLQLDSGTSICRMAKDGYVAEIVVRGEVRIDWGINGSNPERLCTPSEFPDELKQLIAIGKTPNHPYSNWDDDERVCVLNNNWFELSVTTPSGRIIDDVVDVENQTDKELEELCSLAIDDAKEAEDEDAKAV